MLAIGVFRTYIKCMENDDLAALKQTFDPVKNRANIEGRGIGFETARDFEFATALIVEDDRKDYGETRYVGIGFIGARLHVIVFTVRDEELRIISLRKANKREIRAYADS